MRGAIIVFLIALSACGTFANPCQDSQLVRCFIDPCSTPPPVDCKGIARSVASFSSGNGPFPPQAPENTYLHTLAKKVIPKGSKIVGCKKFPLEQRFLSD
jgi:hypothetical protein